MLKDRDSKQSIQVTIRVRPLSQKELNEDSRTCVRLEQINSLHLTSGSEVKKFTFDSICFNQSQQSIFQRVGKRCTIDCLEGYNCTIFAYGQTGAGKTYTMMGVNFEHESYHEHRGLIPRTMQFLFDCIDRERESGVNFIIRCSFLEIYNEQIIDLLNKSNTNLQLREDTRKGVYVEGITEEVITRSEQAMEILNKGSKSRHVGSTFYNEASSRSHSVFTMQIESKYTKNGVSNTKSRQFNFIDLAGSERTKQSTGERLKEGCNINKSLMNLAAVINALSEVSEGKSQHVNYRNSKLTFLLKDSLGGNSKTNLIANISPSTVFYQQTLSTLGFARRAKLIKREKASINQDSSGNLQSMKNQIKRLKQEVISLMSRLQINSEPSTNGVIQQQKPNQMTQIMHQYVEEEIDKQTRLQLEILKLNDRIIHLQNGIKQYSNNEIHLRMIISVYQDKINRLKNIEKTINQNLSNLNEDDEESKAIITYFKNERSNFVKELENIRLQSDNNKFLKELLKQAKIMKEDGEDESLKELLVKNTNFLNNIRSKLDEMKPEKIEFQINSQFQKKISLMQQLYQKKEEEYQERLDQIKLDLVDYKTRNQENQKLLEQSISGQIALEEKVKEEQLAKQKLAKDSQIVQEKLKITQIEMQTIKIKSEESINELKSQINDKQNQIVNSRKEIQQLKAKIEKATLHEVALKSQFESLEEEKYKVDRQFLQTTEQLRESKNSFLKSQSENTLLQQKLQALTSQNQDLRAEQAKIMEIASQKQISLKAMLEEAEIQHKNQLEAKISETAALLSQIKSQEDSIKLLNDKMMRENEEFMSQIFQSKQIQQQYELTIANKEEKLREMLILVNEKELNGNETSVQLNQIKIQLINAHSQMEILDSKYKKMIEELKQKLQKEQNALQHVETQMNSRINLYESLSLDFNSKKKQCADLNEAMAKMHSKINMLEQDITRKDECIKQLTLQLESSKTKEKEQKINLVAMKNELFILQSNSEIEINALKSQNKLKDQQIEHLEKELNKIKLKFEKQIEQLNRDVNNLNESLKLQEESLNKTMENHLSQKERKIADLKQNITEKQQKIQQILEQKTQLETLNNSLNETKEKNLALIASLQQNKTEWESKNQQLKQELQELKQKHEKEIQQMEIIHNEQIDQKNQQIQTFMIENQALQTRLEEGRMEIQSFRAINASLISQITIKDSNYKAVQEQTIILHSQMLTIKQEYEYQISNKSKESSQVTQKYQKDLKEAKQKCFQLERMIQQNQTQKMNLYQQKEEIMGSLKSNQTEIERLNNESSHYVNTISLLTQENYGLNQQINEHLNDRKKREERIIELQSIQLQNQSEIFKLSQKNKSLTSELQTLQQIDINNKQKLIELNNLTNELTNSLESQRQSVSQLMTNKASLEVIVQSLQAKLANKEAEMQSIQEQMKIIENREADISEQLQKLSNSYTKISEQNKQLVIENKELFNRYQKINEKCNETDSQLTKSKEELKSIASMHEQLREKQGKQLNSVKTQNTFLIDQNRKQASEVISLSRTMHELKNENAVAKERISKFEQHHQKLTIELEELHLMRQNWELQANQIDKVRSQIQEERNSKERIYAELTREKESTASLKLLIENKSAQYAQLEVELEEKDAIYKKLVQKIAKNQSESKKTTNSEHYLKTIELLEKSRAEQIQLRRQNQELKKVMLAMKEGLEQKEAHVREIQQKSENYCVSMHKRLEEIQNDYVQLERTHEKLIKERKMYSHDNEQLKEEIKNLKASSAKLVQKHEEMEGKIKKANLDYLQLEKDYEQLKRNDSLLPINNDEKTIYINRLKAEVAALKTEKVLLSQTLNKQREEKTKLKAQMRYGKEGGGEMVMKLELQKKINENKNLTELIFEIISQLKICVNQPKAKLEVIRTIILGAIKDKNTEIKTLKEKARECQAEHQRPKADFHPRELKALSISNSNRPAQELSYKFDKEKDPTYLTNNSRNKLKEIQKYYAKFKASDPSDIKPKN